MTHTRRTLVVAGHGMVSHRFVQAAIQRGLTERFDVVVVGEEPRTPVGVEPVSLGDTIRVGAP